MTKDRAPPPAEPRGATMAQLRADIDSGRTGDKIAGIDHAVAPLGTDEEAAGTPVPPEIVAETRRRECNRTAAPRNSFRATTYRFLLVIAIVLTLVLPLSVLLLLPLP